MILNGLIGRRGHLKSINEYWVVGRFIIVSKLAQDSSRALLAAEQMYKLHPPPWYLRSIFKDLDLLNNKMDNEENTKLFNNEVYSCVLNSYTLLHILKFLPILHRHLDISRVITAESSPLHRGIERDQGHGIG